MTTNERSFDAVIPPAQRRELQQKFEQASRCTQQGGNGHDQAHELLTECLQVDPGNVLYVNAMLENLVTKFGGDPKNAGRLGFFSGKSGFKKAASECNWTVVFDSIPQMLKHNPWDVEVLDIAARACAAVSLNAAELRFLQHALTVAPNSVTLLKQSAEALARGGRFEEAIERWQRVEELDPFDDDAPRMIGVLTLEKTRLQDEDSDEDDEEEEDTVVIYDDEDEDDDADIELEIVTEQPSGAAPKKEPPASALTRRQELERAIRNFPEVEENYLELADVYLEQNRSFEAERTLMKAINISGDFRVLEKLEDVNMLRAQEKVDIARQRAAEEKSDEARQLVEQLLDEKRRLEMEVYRSRCERYPNDKELKFQLGRRMKEMGKFRDSVDWLQAGLELPERQAEASLEIGECLQRFKLFPKALQCYRQAVQLAATSDKLNDCRKRALYRAGVLAESMQLTDSAKQYFEELLKLDSSYMDAKSRLDSLSGMGNNV